MNRICKDKTGLKKINAICKQRLNFIFLFICLFFACLCVNLIKTQVINHKLFIKRASQQYLKVISIPAKRGAIYDRNMKPLVLNMEVASLYAIPSLIENDINTVKKISSALHINENVVFKRLNDAKERNGYFYYLFRKIDEEKINTIKSLQIKGIGLSMENKRYYPGDNFASHLLGFTDMDIRGVNGVELSYNKILSGVDGKLKTEKAPKGILIPKEFSEKFGKREYIQPIDGKSIILTIDEYIQSISERELSIAMEKTQARSGCVIVMDPTSGEILASASYPNFNPNKPNHSPRHFKRNIATSFVYEPGSTFKVFLVAAALQEKAISSQSKFNCKGSIQIGKHIINDHDGKVHNEISVSETIKHSCNIGAVKISLLLGKEKFYNQLINFGFGKKTGVDLPAEENGILSNCKLWKEINLANIAFGQGIAVTPLQVLNAFCALINGGNLYSPRIVKAIIEDENKIKKIQPIIVKNVITKEVSDTMKEIMIGVVEDGTGKKAKIDGYHTGGKTGTAQKPIYGRYRSGYWISSFVGFAPADNPKLAVIVLIDEPKGMYYASEIACPVFREIVRESLMYLGIPQDKQTVLAKSLTKQ